MDVADVACVNAAKGLLAARTATPYGRLRPINRQVGATVVLSVVVTFFCSISTDPIYSQSATLCRFWQRLVQCENNDALQRAFCHTDIHSAFLIAIK
jgi:hypothetical protein